MCKSYSRIRMIMIHSMKSASAIRSYRIERKKCISKQVDKVQARSAVLSYVNSSREIKFTVLVIGETKEVFSARAS